MKMRMLVLVGILSLSLPIVLLAQTSADDLTTVGKIASDNRKTNCPMPTNPTTADWTSTVTCLQSRVNTLESRLEALESRTTPIPVAIPTTPIATSTTPTPITVTPPVTVTPIVPGPTETKAIQNFLKEEGSFTYPTVTGYYGTVTKEAVKKFQTKEGLTVTGLVDKDTLDKMKTLAPTVAPTASASVQQIATPIKK